MKQRAAAEKANYTDPPMKMPRLQHQPQESKMHTAKKTNKQNNDKNLS